MNVPNRDVNEIDLKHFENNKEKEKEVDKVR